MLPFLDLVEKLAKTIKGKSGTPIEGLPVFIAGIVAFFILLALFPWTSLSGFSIALFLSPLWLPLIIVAAAWKMWIILRRSYFIAEQEYMLLEIKLPQSLVKTPLAMEAVISGLHLAPGEGNWYKLKVQGSVRPWWSLEIASIEGQVHFFIWTRTGFRRIIEAQIYAQYPGAQVVEVPDYTKQISARPAEWEIWGCDYVHTRDIDAYPIKTYVDYGLDKVQKEPEQVDPLANLIEFMGSMGKGEQLWMQIIIRTHKGEKYHGKKNDKGEAYTWADLGREEVDNIRKLAQRKSTYTDPVTGKVVISEGFPNPTKGQQETIAAIERNTAKLPFDVGVRAVYLAQPGKFNGITIAGLNGLFKQFNSETLNGLKWKRWMTEFEDYPWEFNVEKRKNKKRKHLIDAYRRRQYFHEPYSFPDYMVMSTEELATLYHIPSHAVTTPSLPRITSATGSAPSNLPL